ncbi:hypothetical protein [Vreelandella malpeensis]|uniref:Uncharacterized protein n=1 Tax=Vreelandella malpeensis TaxID=1172368 RepID=A0ABS8DQ14_9GAMM|nr:hypothetical protein [Halomonas malpeensis]MCB8888338.1 hypothetical protein [Halomonas malpeensis]
MTPYSRHDVAPMSLDTLVLRVIPDLNLAETLVGNTLKSLIDSASDPLDALWRRQQQERFALAVYRLRLILEALLERYRLDVNALLADPRHRPPALLLKDDEVAAIEEAIAIYRHVRAFQRGERRDPVASATR